MENRERFAHAVRFISADDLESQMEIELECFFIPVVHQELRYSFYIFYKVLTFARIMIKVFLMCFH